MEDGPVFGALAVELLYPLMNGETLKEHSNLPFFMRITIINRRVNTMSEENFKILSIKKSSLWQRFKTIKNLSVLAECQGKRYKVNIWSGRPPNFTSIVNHVKDEIETQRIKKKLKPHFNPHLLEEHSFPLNRSWISTEEIQEQLKEST